MDDAAALVDGHWLQLQSAETRSRGLKKPCHAVESIRVREAAGCKTYHILCGRVRLVDNSWRSITYLTLQFRPFRESNVCMFQA